VNVIRVLLMDDHEVVRRGLADLLGAHDDFEVVGEAATAAEALSTASLVDPDVAILDVRLPDGNGIEVCRNLRSDNPDLACLILTSYDDEQALVAAAMAGAHGYLLKDIKGNDFVGAIRRVAAGENLLDADIVGAALTDIHRHQADDPLAALTPQERRLLDHIAEGKTNRQIADEMFLAEKTVKNYVSNLLMKLGMSRRTEAAVFATRLSERRHASGA
jgi:two-component system, NarL family, response regulator DevR